MSELKTAKIKVITRENVGFLRTSEVDTLLYDSIKSGEKMVCIPRINLEDFVADLAVEDLQKAFKEASIKFDSFQVVGAYE